jgi:WD40 repeat protein
MLKYFVSLLLCGLSSVAMAKVNVVVGHTNNVNAVAYSPDGSRIVSGSYDNTLKIWDANSGKLLSYLLG